MTDRGVSTTLNYVLGLAIATLLISGLLFATGDIIEDRRGSVVRGELEVVGERFATSIETADRLHRTDADEIRVDVSVPRRVGGRGYSVEINATRRVVALEATDPMVVVEVPFRNETSVASSTLQGGEAVIVQSGDSLEVRSS